MTALIRLCIVLFSTVAMSSCKDKKTDPVAPPETLQLLDRKDADEMISMYGTKKAQKDSANVADTANFYESPFVEFNPTKLAATIQQLNTRYVRAYFALFNENIGRNYANEGGPARNVVGYPTIIIATKDQSGALKYYLGSGICLPPEGGCNVWK